MKYVALLFYFIRKAFDKIVMHIMITLFRAHGKNVIFFPTNSSFSYKNIILGSDVFIGPGAKFSSITIIKIGNKIMFGPNVSIMGGDHNITQIGQYMYDIKQKLPENDLPITIEDDVWIGTGAIILKGVTIKKGSVVAAGAIVTKDVPEFSIVAGIPARVIKRRFSEEDLKIHKMKLKY